jgi:hypothetical protein
LDFQKRAISSPKILLFLPFLHKKYAKRPAKILLFFEKTSLAENKFNPVRRKKGFSYSL